MAKETARIYQYIPEVAHCPRCHRNVAIPRWLKTNKIGGDIRISCQCKQGAVVIRMKIEAADPHGVLQ